MHINCVFSHKKSKTIFVYFTCYIYFSQIYPYNNVDSKFYWAQICKGGFPIRKAPKYYIIQQYLQKQIADGLLPAGSEVPSETELMKIFPVSRVTVRRALDELAREGYIEKSQGRRAYVRETARVQGLTNISSYTEEILRQGMQPSRTVLVSQIRTCTHLEQESLQLSKPSPVFHLERIYYADQEPLCVTKSVLPHAIFKGIEHHDFSDCSLYDIIEHEYLLKIETTTLKLKAVGASKQLADYLKVPLHTPLLYSNAITYGLVKEKTIPIEMFSTYYLTNNFEYSLTQHR